MINVINITVETWDIPYTSEVPLFGVLKYFWYDSGEVTGGRSPPPPHLQFLKIHQCYTSSEKLLRLQMYLICILIWAFDQILQASKKRFILW